MEKKNRIAVRQYIRLMIGTLPTWYLFLIFVAGTFMSVDELRDVAEGVFFRGKEVMTPFLFPKYPTGRHLIELLLDTLGFYVTYWNAFFQTIVTVVIQIVVSTLASWAFARYDFCGKKVMYFLYLLLMLLPFQVMMPVEYIVLEHLELMNTVWAVILPSGFATSSVIIITSFFKSIPEEMIEAAKLDGAGSGTIFWKIGVPIGKGGIISAILLGFLEQFNAVERPMNFLKDKALWPLSIYLPNIIEEKMSVSFAAAFIGMIPCLLIFLMGQEYLEQGITAGALK